MKKNIILAAFAAASAILLSASCQKQELVEQNNGNASGKTFTATIEQGLTKTTITNEYKVNWVEGDQIDINGTTYSATPDASDATKATFTKVSDSDPDGTFGYTAVYPASIMAGTQATLPATQTYAEGRFNAPMYAESETEAFTFQNICGVLCLSLKGTDKVRRIAVTANEEICGSFEFTTAPAFSITEGGKTVTLDCGAEGVQLSTTGSTNFYIYLPPKDSYTAGMKIVVTSTEGKTFEKTTTTAVKIERNNLYTFNWTATFSGSAEPEYVEIGGVKWATKNLGATTVAGSIETCAGYYFAWGATVLAYSSLSSETFTFVASRPASYGESGWTQSSGFADVNTPYYDGSAYVKYTSTDSRTVLESDDDAATAFLGNGWRMPTSAEFKALYDACGGTETPTAGGSTSTTEKGVYWCDSYDGVAGLLFIAESNGPHLFFPAAGYGDGTDLSGAGSDGFYWSSSLYTDYTDYAYRLYFLSDYVNPQGYSDRYYGFSVRPVKAAAAPLPAGALAGEFTVAEGKKVYFSQGNLQATYNSSTSTYTWGFAANQYDYIGDAAGNTTIDSQQNGSVVDLFGWSTVSTTYGISPSDEVADYSGDFVDWGAAIDDKGTWCTLSKDEWVYLFNNHSYKWTSVHGVNGYVIAPDGFEGTLADSYTDDAALAAGNLVFLPAAGYRDGSSVDEVGDGGNYWSSFDLDERSAYYVCFDSDDVSPNKYEFRYYGCSVRLITDVK